MILYYLPSSAGAIAGCKEAARVVRHPVKPRKLALALDLKDGLALALAGKVGRHNSINVFYFN
jgi:hypothetical protein